MFNLKTGANKLLNLLVFDDFALIRADSQQPLQIALKPLPEEGVTSDLWETKLPPENDLYFLFFGN